MGFIEDYFINPILEGTGYNIVNTLTYGILLIVFLFFLMKILKNWKIRLDEDFWLDLLPFVLLAGVLRALQDIETFNFLGTFQYFFVTPLIYFLMTALVIISLVFKSVRERMTRYIGFALLALSLVMALFHVTNPLAFVVVGAMAVIIYIITQKIVVWKAPDFLDGINKYVLFAQIFDSCATVAALSIFGGFREQHVLPNFLFSFLPVWVFIPIKILIALAAIYIIDRETKDEWNWLLKFAVFVLGMGPGTRDMFALLFS